jgi:hypothetical protein
MRQQVVRRSPAYRVQLSELSDLRLVIVEHAQPDEVQAAERLLGQLATLETQRRQRPRGATSVEFTPPPASAPLARRAIAQLRAGWRIGHRRHRARVPDG